MISKITLLRDYYNQIFELTRFLESPALLASRVYIAWVFLKAGLAKLRDWESTLMLFEYEYQVPVLPFDIAAYLATAGELALPVLLALGFMTKLSALGLFIVNWVAVVAYLDMSQAALNLHYVWGLMMLAIMIIGGGKASVDKLIKLS